MSENLEQSFVKQLKQNQNIIHKICRLYTSGEDAHKDLFQEITIQLWKAYPKFRGDAKFSTWAYRVALNTAITLYRKSTRSVQTTSSEFDGGRHFIPQDEYNYEEEEQIKLLYQAVYQLNDIEKALVFMYLEDKDYAEISETLGISEVNARVKMNRIKGKLKENIKSVVIMEELDLLKKDWKRKENSFSQISEKDIYNMIHHKSSSIVKWILIISILEVLLWTGIGLLYSSDDYLKEYGHDAFVVFQQVIGWINYAIVLVFIYLFYKNYVNISATSSTRKLMKDIIKTRKTVKYYVWYNLAMVTVSLVSGMLLALWYSPQGIALREKMEHEGKIMILIIGVLTLIVIVAIVIFWLFYRLLYGILLRKLIKNYKILEQIDLE